MTEKNKIPTRDKWWGRRVIICECRVPDYYTQEDGTFAGRKPIKAGLVKAVLHEIASWDQPGARNYPSNEKVAYNTQIPLSTVNACTLALKQAKILVKTKRGMNRSSLWILDWSRIDNLRVAWERKPGKPEIEPAPVEDYDEETEAQFAKLNEAASTEPPDPHDPPASTDQTDLLVDEVLQHFAKHAETSTKLPRPHVIKAISRLRQLHDVETIRVAIVALDEIQLSFTLEAENPGGYLWRVLSNLIKDRADRPAPAGSDPQKTQAKDKDKEYAKKLTAYFADQWINDDEEPTPAYEHLVPSFERALLGLRLRDEELAAGTLAYYARFALEDGDYLRSESLEKAAATFLKQIPEWISKYHKIYPGPITAGYPGDQD